MASRSIWLLTGLVCTAHYFLLGSLLNAGGVALPGVGKTITLSLQVIDRPPRDSNVRKTPEVAAPEKPLQPVDAKSASNPQTPVKSEPRIQPEERKSQGPALQFLNRDRFLDFEALDEAAVSASEFEPALTKALPAKFESIVLEFLIDETGRTVLVSCIEGDCSAVLSDELQQLSMIPFTPALKNGEPVASRKVIQVLPAQTFGF